MSGGLSHHTDEENGPSHTVGHKSSKQQGCYSLERNQCACADAIRVPANYKKKRTSLDMTDVVRDVEKVQFPPKEPKFGGYKMPRKLRKSFVELPNAKLFLRISRERVFRQPRLLTPISCWVCFSPDLTASFSSVVEPAFCCLDHGWLAVGSGV